MFLNGGAGALSCACKRNAACMAVDYGNLRKRRRRKAIGEVARGLKAVVLIGIRIGMPKLLQNQRDGVEVFGIKRSVENPRDHGASFYCGCISSTVLPRRWHLIMVPLCSMNSPRPVPLPYPRSKLFLHSRALRGATSRSMRYIESVFSMPLRERCRSTYHRLTEHGGVPDRRTAWDLM